MLFKSDLKRWPLIGGFHMTSPKSKLKTINFSEFYFLQVLQHLKTFFYKKFWFQRVIHFKDAWIFQAFGGGE